MENRWTKDERLNAAAKSEGVFRKKVQASRFIIRTSINCVRRESSLKKGKPVHEKQSVTALL